MLAEQVERVDGLLRDELLTVQRPRPPLIVGGAARTGTTAPAARFAESTTRPASIRRRRPDGGNASTKPVSAKDETRRRCASR